MLSIAASALVLSVLFRIHSHRISPRALRGAGVLLLALAAAAAGAQQQLQNHVRAAVTTRQAHYLSAMSDDETMQLTVVLPLRNSSELSSLLTRLYDPSSPDYRHFLSVQQFTDRFAPTAADYQSVVDFARASGFTVTGTAANRMVVPIRGTVAQVNSAFNVRMSLYQHPTESRTFYSPDREPSLALATPVAHIEGLNNYALPRPTVVQSPSQTQASVVGSGPGGSYLGSDMRAAYYGGSTLDGNGQTVGILSFVGYDRDDVDLTFSNAGQSYTVPITDVLLDGQTTGYAAYNSAEPVLDIVQAIGMAPGLSGVTMYIGMNDADILNQMASDNTAKVLSCSWSWYPDDPSTDEPIFQEFAAQGQTFLVASGDNGAFDSYLNYVIYPQEDPYVTSVGGTHLTTVSAGGAWSAETAWNSQGYGSSGGISLDGLALPSYQAGVATASNGGSTTLRNVPDVAMEGDFDNYYCNAGYCSQSGAGTSFAAPRWAGFLAMTNQQAIEAGNAPAGGIGFINPTLYSIGAGSSYGDDLHDVISGNNKTSGQSVWYNAVAGYDLVTGWGSPTGQKMIDALAGPQTPGFWLQPSVSNVVLTPGASAATTITVTDAGTFTGAVNLAVTGLPTGVTASWDTNPATSTSTLTLKAASSITTPSTTALTITGTSGSITATTQVSVAVHLPSFTLTNSGSVDLGIGGTASNYIYMNPLYGFSGGVTYTVSGLPTGVTGTFTPNPSTGTTQLVLTAASSATVGSSTVTVTGTSGSLSATTTFTLGVHQPTFTLTASGLVDIGIGGSASTYVTVFGQYGFAANVSLSISGLPAGVTGLFSTNPTTSYSTLSFSATSTAVAGTYPVTITGVSGSITETTSLSLVIHQPTFTVTGSSSVSVGTGNSSTASFYVNPLYSFSGSVTFSASGLPAGVTASFTPNPTTYTTTMTLTASSAAAPGLYTATVTGTSGSITASIPISVTVGTPTFSISANSPASIGQGSSGQSSVYIQDSYGFTSSVTLSVSGLPAGATALWNPNPTAYSSTLTITTGSSTPVGQYPLTITGTSGSLTKTAAITLSVATPTFTLYGSSSITVGQGASTSGYLNVDPQYGFTGSVTLAASGLPSGVTAVFTPNPVVNSGTVTFIASSAAVAGQYNVTVTGTSGSQSATTPITLTVAAPSFTLSSYGGVNLGQGATGTTNVYVNPQNGFTGNVTLAVSGLPAGVTAAFATNPTASGSVLTFTASGTAATGQYNVVVTGTSGSLTATSNVSLTVSAPTFTLSAPYSIDLGQGTSSIGSVYVYPQYGFVGAVSFSLSALPAGVTATFSQNPTSSSSTITFTATSSATLGQYTVLLTGTSGSQSVTTPITIGVYTPSFSISGLGSINLGQGASATSYVYVNAAHGFNSPVTFTTSGLPSGVTAAFSPNPTTGTATLTLSASSTAAIGQYNVTVTGTSGTQTASLSFALGVYAQGFSLSNSQPLLTLSPGGSGTSVVYVYNLYGFSGNVTLAASGLPTGVTASFATNPTTNTSVATFTAAANAPASTSTALITGTSGTVSSSTPITLIVNTPGFTLSGSPSRVALLAGQSRESTVTVTPLNIFTGNVTLAVTGLPAGVTATVSPNPTSSTAIVTLTASGAVTAGTTNATITGTSGSITSTTPLAISILNTPAATTTALSATTGGKAFTTTAAGSSVTLTASVTAGASSVTAGQVLFCESTATVCDAAHSLGVAQLASSGSAILRFVPAAGSHSIVAQFEGYNTEAASISTAAAFQVTPALAASTTALTESGSASSYTLIATVTGPGSAAPTGSVSFLDTTSTSLSLGTASLQAGSDQLAVATAQTPSTGTLPIAAATGDFNRDGIADLAIANNGDNTLTILLGNGDGTFTASGSKPPTGASPSAVLAGDFNRDGKLDLAVADSQSNAITILLGNGDGTFTASTLNPATGTTPVALAAADFNGDGLLDLAVVNSGSTSVTLLLGNGDGTFTTVSQAANAGSNPVAAAVGDFNGDGVPDLAIANFYQNTVTLLLGNGDGTFTTGSTLNTGSYPRQLAVTDLNADGKQDLIALASYDSVDVFLGNGDGTFASASTTEVGGSPLAFALADFSGDGNLDLAVTTTDKHVTLLLGNGDGTFTADGSASAATGSTPSAAVSADFNGDGWPDIAALNMQDNTASILTPQLLHSATASLTGVTFAGSGNHTAKASYPGDSVYKASTSGTLTLAGTAVPATIAVTPSTPYIAPTQAVAVTVTAQPHSGSPTPTGTLTLTAGSYSAQQTLSSGSASFTVPAGSLTAGAATLNASYTPDSTSSNYYTASTGIGTLTVVAAGAALPSITVTPTPSTVTDLQSASVTVLVSGTAGSTPSGAVTLVAGGVATQKTLSGGMATFTVPGGTFQVGTQTLTAYYSGDSVYNNGTANGTLSVAALGLALGAAQAVPPGSSTTATVSLAASSTFSGTVALGCSLTQSPTGAQSLPTCTLSPTSLSLTSGGSGSATLTVHTTAAPTTAMLHQDRKRIWGLGLGAPVLALAVLFGIPSRRRKWMSMLVLLAGMLALGSLGCGGGGSTGGGGGGTTTPATTAGSYTFTVTAAGASTTVSNTVVVTVQ